MSSHLVDEAPEPGPSASDFGEGSSQETLIDGSDEFPLRNFEQEVLHAALRYQPKSGSGPIFTVLRQLRRALKPIAFLLAAGLGTAGLMLFIESGVVEKSYQADKAELRWWLLGAAVLVILLRIAMAEKWRRRRRSEKQRSDIDLPLVRNPTSGVTIAESAAVGIRSEFDASAYEFVVKSLASPVSITGRTTQTLSLNEQSVKHSVRRTLRLPALPANGKVVFPILVHRARKGILIDSFTCEVNGKRVSTLSYEENQAMTHVAVNLFLAALLDEKTLSKKQVEIWDSIMTAICSSQPVRSQEFHKYVKEFARQLKTIAPHYKVDELAGIVTDLSVSYLVWARVTRESATEVRLGTSYTVPGTAQMLNIADRLRIRLGLLPRQLNFLLPLALETRSFHLSLELPDGMYLYSADLRLIVAGRVPHERPAGTSVGGAKWRRRWKWLKKAMLRSNRGTAWSVTNQRQLDNGDELTGVAPDFRRSGIGLDYLHYYIRDLHAVRSRTGRAPGDGGSSSVADRENHLIPAVQVEIRETPPGNLLLVSVVAVYLALVTWGVGTFYPDVMAPSGKWSTLLFGIPAIVSSWIVAKFSSGSMSRSSFTTLGVVLWTFFNAMGAVGLSALRAVGGMTWNDPQISKDVWWLILMASTLANMVLIIQLMLARSSRYLDRIRTIDRNRWEDLV